MWLILSNGVNRVNHRSENLGDVRPAHAEVPSEVSASLDDNPIQQGVSRSLVCRTEGCTLPNPFRFPSFLPSFFFLTLEIRKGTPHQKTGLPRRPNVCRAPVVGSGPCSHAGWDSPKPTPAPR